MLKTLLGESELLLVLLGLQQEVFTEKQGLLGICCWYLFWSVANRLGVTFIFLEVTWKTANFHQEGHLRRHAPIVMDICHSCIGYWALWSRFYTHLSTQLPIPPHVFAPHSVVPHRCWNSRCFSFMLGEWCSANYIVSCLDQDFHVLGRWVECLFPEHPQQTCGLTFTVINLQAWWCFYLTSSFLFLTFWNHQIYIQRRKITLIFPHAEFLWVSLRKMACQKLFGDIWLKITRTATAAFGWAKYGAKKACRTSHLSHILWSSLSAFLWSPDWGSPLRSIPNILAVC